MKQTKELNTKYYTQRGIALMNSFESGTRRCFSIEYSDLETAFWIAADTKDRTKLIFLVNRIAKICDEAGAQGLRRSA